VARKTTPVAEEAAKPPPEAAKREAVRELIRKEEERQELESYKPETRERNIIVRRPLPTLKEILPPLASPPIGERNRKRDGPIRLDTGEPQYVSYFTSIKRAIEIEWVYPEPALRHGLQGKLILEFTILGDGKLEGMRLIRSSGFPVLDQEAIRAVQAASPFQPIPPWIGKSRLDIIASFEYHDNRVRYGILP